MSKRFLRGNITVSSPLKKFKPNDTTGEIKTSKEKKSFQNANGPITAQSVFDDIWGDDFGEDDIEQMDIVASQHTQVPQDQKEEEFKAPLCTSSRRSINEPSTSARYTKGVHHKTNGTVLMEHSQVLSHSPGSLNHASGIYQSTQTITSDDFQKSAKTNFHSSTFCNRQDVSNIVLVSDNEEADTWKEERKKLLEELLTKDGETEYLRQQSDQLKARAENAKKELTKSMEDERLKFQNEKKELLKQNTALQSQLDMQTLNFKSASEKLDLLKSGSIKLAQPQVNYIRPTKDRNNATINSSLNSSFRRVKTKEVSVQVVEPLKKEILKSSIIHYPLKTMPQCIFELAESEKSVVEIKIEEKTGRKNLAIIQDEETFRIYENPELSWPKVTIINGKNLTTEFYQPDLARLMNKSNYELNSTESILTLNKLIATSRELFLNSTLVLKKISQALQNDDIRDMNELYLSGFYEMPAIHTHNFCEAKPWYELERGIETRRAVGCLAYLATASDYVAEYLAGKRKLRVQGDVEYESYSQQMKSYKEWYKESFPAEFLDLILEFVTVVGSIRRAHQFTGLLMAILTLLRNIENKIDPTGLERVCRIVKEIIYSRPLISCFGEIVKTLKTYCIYDSFSNKLCVAPAKSGIRYWKESMHFTTDACTLQILTAQLKDFKLDPITIVNLSKSLTRFCNIVIMNNSIPWIEQTMYTCNCCLNLLKVVILNLCECSKISVEEIKIKCLKTEKQSRKLLKETSKKNRIVFKNHVFENWISFEKHYKGDFWEYLKTTQLIAMSYGVRLLSYLAKRDADCMIRDPDIEYAFHIILKNLSKRKDLKLKESDEVALNIVKKTFVVEKKEETKSTEHKISLSTLENEKLFDFSCVKLDLEKLNNALTRLK